MAQYSLITKNTEWIITPFINKKEITMEKKYKKAYKELEKKEGEIDGVAYTILKVEYTNLEQLKKDDLLMSNDKGQWLFGFVGLKKYEEVNFNELEKQVPVTDMYLDKSQTDLFTDKEEINKIIFFDQNHSWNRYPNTQLDEKLCLSDIEKIVKHIKEYNLNKEAKATTMSYGEKQELQKNLLEFENESLGYKTILKEVKDMWGSINQDEKLCLSNIIPQNNSKTIQSFKSDSSLEEQLQILESNQSKINDMKENFSLSQNINQTNEKLESAKEIKQPILSQIKLRKFN